VDYSSAPGWRNDFVLASRVASAGTRAAFYRAAKAGHYQQLARGVWLPTAAWKEMSQDDRYLAKVQAVAIRHELTLVFSHFSAAALWHLPMVGSRPARPEVRREPGGGGRSATAFLAHTHGLPFDLDLDLIDELTVTTLARTVVDVARTASLGTAVAMADHALGVKSPRAMGVDAAMVTSKELAETLVRHPAAHGVTSGD
jgi:hypothetical protein